MADHARNKHGVVMSADPLKDYEFSKTGTFMKPLNRQVDKYLRISRAERDKIVKIGRKVWTIILLNRKHEYWAPRSMIVGCDFVISRPGGRRFIGSHSAVQYLDEMNSRDDLPMESSCPLSSFTSWKAGAN